MKYKFPFEVKDWHAVVLMIFVLLQTHLGIEKSALKVKQLKLFWGYYIVVEVEGKG